MATTGAGMYLTKIAMAVTLRPVAVLAPGSTLAMSIPLPIELADPEVRPRLELAAKGAQASGTSRRQILHNATSRPGQTAFARQITRRNWR